jgi:hypothetical protein
VKKLLIIADGMIAEEFIKRVTSTYSDVNVLDIVYYRGNIIEDDVINCTFHKFDPTSFSKLEAIFTREHITAYIVMDDPNEAMAVYKNLRTLSKDIMIYLLDNGNLKAIDDGENTRIIKLVDITANRFMAAVPNIPVSAQFVGLRSGDIIEVMVPFGSSFAYRHIGNVEQREWRVGAIYRANELILPTPATMILPGDNLLLIGQPNILKNVHRAIKLESGQFPAPFGRNAYMLLDMANGRSAKAELELNSALSIHDQIKNKILFIKVINPDSLDLLSRVRELNKADIVIDIAYRKFDIYEELKQELGRLNVGLLIVNPEMFEKRKNRVLFQKIKRPVLKLGYENAARINKAAVPISSNPNYEQISSTIFDLSAQLSLNIFIYPANVDSEGEGVIIRHFDSLARLHSRAIFVYENEENPILHLRNEDNILLFFPYEKNMISRTVLDLFNPKRIERLNAVLKSNHQIFIPVY